MKKIAIIGLGYVGLPLATAFGKSRNVLGFDINKKRIDELKKLIDVTLETTKDELKSAIYLNFTSSLEDIKECEIFIITVPTPIDINKKPDLNFVKESCNMIAQVIKKEDIVIFESTVYPGVTEEICAPIIEEKSGLKYNKDFFCGYSPERINPGDKEHRLTNIVKVTSGSTTEVAEEVNKLYSEIISAGTYLAKSIKVAEAAKVIENTQRDVNIALINELSLIFNKLDIDTEAVLEAAGTKWNFLPFKPGLVGGHCISVDPYYLTHKAIEVGYYPEIILAGRQLNDGMGRYIANQSLDLMAKKKIDVSDSKILIMGLTFKENCPDLRNTRVIDIVDELKKHNCNVDLFDPWVNKHDVAEEFKIKAINKPMDNNYDAIIIAVAHDEFKNLNIDDVRVFAKKNHIIYDVKHIFNAIDVDGRL
jgi:UDP-N-acetyl-D-glucosamine/UDP-N-acetyl-D-galactosamine dehydrogenase